MGELIRYSWGTSSLGDFLAAVSDKGLVTFEFADSSGAKIDALHDHLPGASLEEDANGLATTVTKLQHLIDQPGTASDLVLDMRGSDYQKQVWTLLQTIPPGQTTNYGSLAERLGTRDARDVTEAIGSNKIAILIPCHRVLKKDGSISGYRWGVHRKRALLKREQG